MTNLSESKQIEQTLRGPDIHQEWEDAYRIKENEKLYELAFDYIATVVDAPENATILDAGCGIGAHSVRLAKRGFSVLAVDFSEFILQEAHLNIQNDEMAEKIDLRQENILSLSFADGTFDYILCWGVLMHMPDIEQAISEIDRVLKKDGILIMGENNMFSLQTFAFRSLRRLLRRKGQETEKKTAAGLEYWRINSSGKLLTRQANPRWLKSEFENRGFVIQEHVASQFTEIYKKFSLGTIKKLIHLFNSFWFKYIKDPRLAYGNIIILKKQG